MSSALALHQLTVHLHNAPKDPALALVFPGQGAQRVGMGKDLYDVSPTAREVFERADSVLGFPLSQLCFLGPEEELRQTLNAQPAILAASLACLAAALERGALARCPAFLAGHSLGEYTALVAAGALEVDDALLLVRERGRLMQEAGQRQEGGLVAIMGLEEEQVLEIARLSGAEACNFNSAAQIVLGGSHQALDRVLALAKERRGRAQMLNVSGAFHTSLMRPAAEEFARFLDGFTIRDPRVPVVANASASPLTTAEAIREELKQQILRPVLWRQSVLHMAEAGANTFLEIGPGHVLTSLIKRTLPDAVTLNIDGIASLGRADV